jgi:hypothetical protein
MKIAGIKRGTGRYPCREPRSPIEHKRRAETDGSIEGPSGIAATRLPRDWGITVTLQLTRSAVR